MNSMLRRRVLCVSTRPQTRPWWHLSICHLHPQPSQGTMYHSILYNALEKDTISQPHKLPSNLKSHLLLNLRNRQPRIQALRTSPRTVQDSMTPIQTHTIIQRRLPLLLLLIPAIRKPPITLQQHRGSQILLTIPPIRRARGRATGAENAFVEAV
jgi:hypothetical protein